MKTRLFAILIIISIILAGCKAKPQPTALPLVVAEYPDMILLEKQPDGDYRMTFGEYTPTPTSTPTETPTPTFTSTPTETPTNTPTLIPTQQFAGVPYGPLHNSDYDRPFFSGAAIAGREWANLPYIRLAHYRVTAAAAVANPCAHVIDGEFSVEEFIGEIVAHKAEILDYASDGTLIGLLELNEPHNPSACDPIPVPKLAEAATAFWAAFPELSKDTFYFGYDTPPQYLEDGGGAPDVNMLFIQYAPNKGTLEEWGTAAEESAVSQGITAMVYSDNMNGRVLDEVMAEQIWMCNRPYAILVSMWKDTYVNDADADKYQAVLNACSSVIK